MCQQDYESGSCTCASGFQGTKTRGSAWAFLCPEKVSKTRRLAAMLS